MRKWLRRLSNKINRWLFPNGIDEEIERHNMIDYLSGDDCKEVFTEEERKKELEFLIGGN